MVLGGRKVAVRRPRVRTAAGEVALPTFETMADTDPLDRRVKAMTQTPTKTQILLVRLAVAPIVAFAVVGVAMYGFSAEVRQRIWRNLLERPSGPMTFRFILQPIMASIVAWRDGARRGLVAPPSIGEPDPVRLADTCRSWTT